MGAKTLDELRAELTIQTDRGPGAAWACGSQLPDQRPAGRLRLATQRATFELAASYIAADFLLSICLLSMSLSRAVSGARVAHRHLFHVCAHGTVGLFQFHVR